MVNRTLMLLLLLLPAFAAEARLELPDPLIPGVMMEGRVVVANADAPMRRVVLPKVDGIEWQMRGDRSTQTTITNGQVVSTESVGVSLRIAKTGTYQIPAATVHLNNGSSLNTTPLTITVKEGDTNLSGEALAEARFEPDTIVPGQPTTLILKLNLLQGQIRTLGIGPPAQAISLGERTIKEGQVYDAQGQRWVEVTVSWPLTFAKSEVVTVSGQQPYEITVGNGFFNSRMIQRQVPVKPASLTVAPLPSEGRPEDFTGLIGAVTVSATLDRPRIATGEGVQLAVTYRGRGVELLGRPTLPAIAGVTAYAKDDDSKAATTAGERVFRWDVVPATTGTVAIPAFSVPFFDPASRTYRRAASEPLTLTVIPGRTRSLEVAGTLTPASTPTAAPAPTAVVLTGIAALPSPLRGNAVSAIPWSWSLVVLCATLGLGLIVGLAGRMAGTLRRGPHRGRVLAEAIASGDLERIANALFQLQGALTNDAQRSAASRLMQAVDVARFGKQALPADALALVKELEGVA